MAFTGIPGTPNNIFNPLRFRPPGQGQTQPVQDPNVPTVTIEGAAGQSLLPATTPSFPRLPFFGLPTPQAKPTDRGTISPISRFRGAEQPQQPSFPGLNLNPMAFAFLLSQIFNQRRGLPPSTQGQGDRLIHPPPLDNRLIHPPNLFGGGQ